MAICVSLSLSRTAETNGVMMEQSSLLLGGVRGEPKVTPACNTVAASPITPGDYVFLEDG